MLANALIITRRELRDSLRDWRILLPIGLLTLGFPWLMLGIAQVAFQYARNFDQDALFITLVPFSIMIVGFFPISFCLVIALEAFVGEKERASLEPLLSMPIEDIELYIGKLLASMALPLLGSYLAITEFVLGLKWLKGLDVPFWMITQIGLLTGLESLVMVSGAVVVSSHTTSIRAANLLASFIIVPMTLLVQVESLLLLNNRSELLWHVMAGLLVANLIVGRMGLRLFNREEILAREMDELHVRGLLGTFWRFLKEGRTHFSFRGFYRSDFGAILSRTRNAIIVTVGLMLLTGLLGAVAANIYRLPEGAIQLRDLSASEFRRMLDDAPSMGLLPRLETGAIFFNNVRSLAAAGLLGLFSFGSLALILLMVPVGIIGYAAGAVALGGLNPWQFLTAFILPHGILEMPAAILATALALHMGASLISPRANMTAGESLLSALADFLRVFILIVVPLLLAAAWVEAQITPEIVIWFYGR
ncbi:MAG: stage II sporulation protein M [Chloroflexi bacterium]|nr:stage II sporulation protein M [Chloroflexota bacterium]